MRFQKLIGILLGTLFAALTILPAFAESRGAVTNLPIPRFVSMKASEANVRRGPSLTHRIDWVYKHRNMPLEITAEFGHWRRVRDMEGAGGWVHFTLLSGVRTVVITEDLTELLTQPKSNALPSAQLKAGVIARLQDCTTEWCFLTAQGYKGWAPKETIWGVGAEEIRD
jgi:SH3-like domain-containing protein